MRSSSPTLRRFSRVVLYALAALTAAAFASPLHAAPRGAERPALTPDQARALLSLSGANVGSVRNLDGIGRVRIDGISVGADGRWLVIRVLPSVVK
jgi:hypothetical protein